ncbi:MAG: sulfatase-like hydrolase/transferase, partial [Deltaproteobacteria bacterium]|nr:sulfatase-like hydrolase/transferase [Deltaproteobacteria bacterium]
MLIRRSTRRKIILSIVHDRRAKAASFCSVLIMLLLASMISNAQANRPNVIIFVADDLGWADPGFRGGPIETPNLDGLARDGLEFERFYATPICSPTRAALHTGRDPMRLGVVYNTIMAWHNNGVHPDERFMPEAFLETGYQTAMVGKWHLGHAQQTYHPNARGYEHFYGHLHTEVGYFPPFAVQGGKDFQQNGKSIEAEGYETFTLAKEASRWIRNRDVSRPFFLYVPFIAPHTSLDAPDDLKAKYADLEDDRPPARSKFTDDSRRMSRMLLRPSARPVYAAVVDAMDQAIGQILAAVDEEGIRNNTLVLFISDNGGAAYASGGANNAPFRGGKGETFEGGIRVVALMRWPAKIDPGTKVPDIVSVMDVFPTLAGAAGIEPGNDWPLDGRNLWPLLAAGERFSLDRKLFFAAEMTVPGTLMTTVFDDEWKLVQRIVQTQLTTDVTQHLFRINDDPYERNNLAAAHPELVADLSEEVVRWRSLHPIGGTPRGIVPPPGWRAPRDWASYPIPIEDLLDEPAPGMAPPALRRVLDWQHGEQGRVIYGCEPYAVLG